MRQKIAAANWKMNKLYMDGLQLATDILVKLKNQPPANSVVLCPPFIHLADIGKMIEKESHLHLGAQNCYWQDSGAYTGEISAPMLSSIGVKYVIIGHSERRQLFGETNETVTKKVKSALAHGLKVIFCCGEPLEIRNSQEHKNFVKAQVMESLFSLSASELKNMVIAYEPIWAIGTGITASPEQAQEMHNFIRKHIAEKFTADAADDLTVLYGGSVNADNADTLFSQPDVDGALVGGASLKADDFVRIIKSLEKK